MDSFVSYEISIDVSKQQCTNQINVVQGEKNSREVWITLTDGSRKIELNPVTDIAVIRGIKPDDCMILNPAIIEMDSRIYYKFNSQDLAVVGELACAVQVIRIDNDDRRILHTGIFKVHVGKSLYNDEKITSLDEYGVLLEEINKIDSSIYVSEFITSINQKVKLGVEMEEIGAGEIRILLDGMKDVISEDEYIVFDPYIYTEITDSESEKFSAVMNFIVETQHKDSNKIEVDRINAESRSYRLELPYVGTSKRIVSIAMEAIFQNRNPQIKASVYVKYRIYKKRTINEYAGKCINNINKKFDQYYAESKKECSNLIDRTDKAVEKLQTDTQEQVNMLQTETRQQLGSASQKIELWKTEAQDTLDNAIRNAEESVEGTIADCNERVDNVLVSANERVDNVIASANERLDASVEETNQKVTKIKEDVAAAQNKINELGEDIDSVGNVIAVFGETSFNEVNEAIQKGKNVVVKYNDGKILDLTRIVTNASGDITDFSFANVYNNQYWVAYLRSGKIYSREQWEISTNAYPTYNEHYELMNRVKVLENEDDPTFVATYGTTKFAEIQDAYEKGKRVTVEEGWLKGELNIFAPDDYAQFSALDDMGNPVTFKITSDDQWLKTSYTHVPLNDFDNRVSDVNRSLGNLRNAIDKNSFDISNIMEKLLDLDYDYLEANSKYYIESPGLYLFVGNDYDLNLYNINQGNTSYAVLGKEKNLIIAMLVTRNKNDPHYLRTFYGKTYKQLGIATPESSIVDLCNMADKRAYIHNTSNNGRATIFHIKA